MAGKSLSTIIGWVLLVSLFVAESGVSIPLPVNRTEDKGLKSCKNYWLFMVCCQRYKCVRINVYEVLKTYPNLFRWKSFKRIYTPLNSDMDTCCPTLRTFDNSTTRINVNGVERVIFQSDWLHQLIPVGSCIDQGGTCKNCQIQNRTMSILVVDFEFQHALPLEFDQFSIPLYCSCFGP